jgi:hypothetical protein
MSRTLTRFTSQSQTRLDELARVRPRRGEINSFSPRISESIESQSCDWRKSPRVFAPAKVSRDVVVRE